MPLKKDENKTLKVLRRTLNEPEPQPKNSSGGGTKRKITSLTSRYDDFDTLEIFQEPVEVCRTYDRPQHSMNILAKLIPDAENCLVIDIYSARRPITDRNGTRLQGTQPYANDIHVPKHHGHCKVQLENNKGTWVMLAGLPVMRWFEAIWGKVTTQGQIVNIGGRDRRVYWMDHMEYTEQWASHDRLKELRATLLQMRSTGIMTSTEYLDEKLARTAGKTKRNAIVLDGDDINLPEDLTGDVTDTNDTPGLTENAEEPTTTTLTPEDHDEYEQLQIDIARIDEATELYENAKKLAENAEEPTTTPIKPEYPDEYELTKNIEEPTTAPTTPEEFDACEPLEIDIAQIDEAASRIEHGVAFNVQIRTHPKRPQSINSKHKQWWNEDSYREYMSDLARILCDERWNGPNGAANRKHMAEKQTFVRDDSDPVKKKKWDDKVAAAKKWVDGLSNTTLENEYAKAFMMFRLDPKDYGVSTFRARPEDAAKSRARWEGRTNPQTFDDRIRNAIFERANSTGQPFFKPDELDALYIKVKGTEGKVKLGMRMNSEHRAWIRSDQVLRKKNIRIDYANIRYMQWLA